MKKIFNFIILYIYIYTLIKFYIFEYFRNMYCLINLLYKDYDTSVEYKHVSIDIIRWNYSKILKFKTKINLFLRKNKQYKNFI